MSSAVSTTTLNRPVPEFTLTDYGRNSYSLQTMSGVNGLLLAFIGDIWKPVSVHRILGLHGVAGRLAAQGWRTALVVRGQPQTLQNFLLASPMQVQFPLLADTDGEVHSAYGHANSAGLFLIDRGGMLRYKWRMTGEAVWPDTGEIVRAVQSCVTK